jgi:hypothetical protein
MGGVIAILSLLRSKPGLPSAVKITASLVVTSRSNRSYRRVPKPKRQGIPSAINRRQGLIAERRLLQRIVDWCATARLLPAIHSTLRLLAWIFPSGEVMRANGSTAFKRAEAPFVRTRPQEPDTATARHVTTPG